MKRDFVDFFAIPEAQLAMHERLCNWARYVEVHKPAWPVSPIWRKGRSNGRQWHAPVIRDTVDTLDGHRMELAVRKLPEPHMQAVRWHYVWRTHPAHARRIIGVSNEMLMRLVKDGRSMLINRTKDHTA